jgi:hypothetical protein
MGVRSRAGAGSGGVGAGGWELTCRVVWYDCGVGGVALFKRSPKKIRTPHLGCGE